MSKSKISYQILVLIIAQILLIGVYKDGDYSDFDDFIKHANSLGYPVEEHFVETQDGFIISIHRIKPKNSTESTANTFQSSQIPDLKKKYPILMGHGLGGSSDVFIRNTEEKSISFFLVNKGYDVFIMNSRGNNYSHQHKKYTREENQYWDFSFQEMAQYDLPAVSKYILEQVFKVDSEDQSEERLKMNYIGHSQGCTIVLTALSEQYVPSHFFDEVVLMTPAAIPRLDSPVINFLKKHDILSPLREKGMHSLAKMNTFTYYLCRSFPSFCKYTASFATDSIESPINFDLFYQLMYHYPAGISTKAYIHFYQLLLAGKFQLFDNGSEKNMQVYNQVTPPEIRLNNITNKIHILAGSEDLATPVEDIYYLKSKLVNSKNVTVIEYNEGHCSFIIGKNNEYLNYIPQVFQ